MIDIKCTFEKQNSLTYFDAFPDWVIQSCNVVLLSSDNIDTVFPHIVSAESILF